MEVVVLGEKKDGRYRVLNPYLRRNEPNPEIKIDETKRVEVRPFPFNTFSSLDGIEEDWEKCYLVGEISIEPDNEEWLDLDNGSSYTNTLGEMDFTLLGEYHSPFMYAWSIYNDHKGVSTHDLTTWLIHEETRNLGEFMSMERILKEGITQAKAYGYTMNISLDKYVIPYLPLLLDNEVSFGRYGTVDYSPEFLALLTDGRSFDEWVDTLKKLSYYPTYIFKALPLTPYSENEIRSWIFKNLKYLTSDSSKGWEENREIVLKYISREMFVANMIPKIIQDAMLDGQLHYTDENKSAVKWLQEESVELQYTLDYRDPEDPDYWDENMDEYFNTPFDERVTWLRAVFNELDGMTTLEEVKKNLSYVHENLWKEIENQDYK